MSPNKTPLTGKLIRYSEPPFFRGLCFVVADTSDDEWERLKLRVADESHPAHGDEFEACQLWEAYGNCYTYAEEQEAS